MIAVPLWAPGTNELIGILKIEREKGRDIFTNENLDVLIQVGTSFAKHIADCLGSGTALAPGREYEFRIPRVKKESFESKPIGGVLIRHVMTSICQSDLYYFKHEKDTHKLDERLPMVLGHETVGEILRTSPDARDKNLQKILPGDRVVVIPLIPCGSCHICKGKYGENYCPSSRFMASNAPGSLRSSYSYDPSLTLRISSKLDSHLAVFTEPLANVVQLLAELGFGNNEIRLEMKPFAAETFTYFSVSGQSQFTSIFNTIVEQLPLPRTLFVLSDPEHSNASKVRKVSQQWIMRKGLGLLGQRNALSGTHRWIHRPRVLILGTSISAYLLAAMLRYVYHIPRTHIAVTGRTQSKLGQFLDLASVRVNTSDFRNLDGTRHALEMVDKPAPDGGLFDIAFECVGGKAVDEHIRLALEVLKSQGVLAMFGMTDDLIDIDFTRILEKEIFIKGTYRASLQGFSDTLKYITENTQVRSALEKIIDRETVVQGFKGVPHDIRNEEHLTEVFRVAGAYRKNLGRLIVGRLGVQAGQRRNERIWPPKCSASSSWNLGRRQNRRTHPRAIHGNVVHPAK